MIARHFIAYTPIIFRCIPDKTSFSKYLCSDFALTYIIYPSFGFNDIDDEDLKLVLDAFKIKLEPKLYTAGELRDIRGRIRLF